ncbi:superoxide dismutase [Domibacillus sp. DTU_2020_1001157_1_SI_ALB_TIR_016]|uniref:superoxide dismutase n=1 Tax=Domibacillus sp. DTU_2020_1001157_1_SI_ALB_TIR_016 TaxID=3077789 RepID=UPI0039776E4D
MFSHEKAYRATLLNWCKHVEQQWKSIREKAVAADKKALDQWEAAFLSLKKNAEEEHPVDPLSLSSQAAALYNQLPHLLQQPSSFKQEKDESKPKQPVPIGGHRLPPLPYAYNALEPVISEEIMKLHHDKHHQSYVDGLNKAEKEMQKARRSGDFSLIKHWEREAAFHGAGHYLHTIFWAVMTPGGGGLPAGELNRAITNSFGSFDGFKKHFSEAAKNVEGVGWAILVWSPRSRRLEILTAEKHQNLSQWDVVPLLPLDVWEHAYYLQYKNERAKYVDAWWKVVNWKEVEHRFAEAKNLTWEPF